MLKFGDETTFALWFEPRDGQVRHQLGASPEIRTLGSLEIRAGREILTRTKAGHERVEDVPLLDVASWLAQGWNELLFDLRVPSTIAGDDRRVNKAAYWALSESVPLDDDAQAKTFAWAERHALEFAATDYALPNVVFQRIDDAIEISWTARTAPAAGTDVVFDAKAGAVLMDVGDFAKVGRDVMEWVVRECAEIVGDPRIDEISVVVKASAENVAAAALRRWYPSSGDTFVRELRPDELEAFGRFGAARDNYATAFLRSSVGALTAVQVRAVLRRVKETPVTPADPRLYSLAAQVDVTIDPRQPWESGLRLAGHARVHLALGDGRVDIEELLNRHGVSVIEHRFGDAKIDGACFVTRDRAAVAVINPHGRLARSKSGRRTTLAHELCHVMFDSRGGAIGQLDTRGPESYLEKRANKFAAELLLPSRVLLGESDGKRIKSSKLKALCAEYGVSKEMATNHAENQGLRITA